jgi:myb proto-oncogene protein
MDVKVNGQKTKTEVPDEDSKLKDAVQMHGGKNWPAIATLVPGRTNEQCRNRWRAVLDHSIDQATELKGVCWTAVEDRKLKDAVQIHGGKNWPAIAALVPGRTKEQWRNRWRAVLDPSIDRATELKGVCCTAVEDSKLKDAIQTHGGKNWAVIAALVPGRTERQCRDRWNDALYPSIALTVRRACITWTVDEDIKLKDALRMHGGKNWAAIAALVLSRTQKQCRHRWQILQRRRESCK